MKNLPRTQIITVAVILFALSVSIQAYNSVKRSSPVTTGVILDSEESQDMEENKNTKIIETPNDTVIEWTEVATFAAWCFWCTEAVFQEEPWVLDAISGYAWWTLPNPTYEQVWYGKSDYREAIQVTYNPGAISYDRLLELMFKSIDPTDAWGQFGDRWFHYTTAIFPHTDEQSVIAIEAISALQKDYEKPIDTKVLPFTTFYEAEEYHQDFYKHSAERYGRYKKWSGRTKHFEETWLDEILEDQQSSWVDKEALRARLTPLQRKVTQENWTERSFDNEYRDNKAEWLYVDIVSWEPLYSSKDKYKSWTGRPSFTKPISPEVVTLHEDKSLWATRTEVRSAQADSHLWHVFSDWPDDAWWLRYCMNSASMNFIPLDEMEQSWYWDRIEYVQ